MRPSATPVPTPGGGKATAAQTRALIADALTKLAAARALTVPADGLLVTRQGDGFKVEPAAAPKRAATKKKTAKKPAKKSARKG